MRGLAVIGDLAKKFGMKNPPLTSFRLANLLQPMVHDLEPLEGICGPLPYSMGQGVLMAVDWLKRHGDIDG
jgi:hypothetical protein